MVILQKRRKNDGLLLWAFGKGDFVKRITVFGPDQLDTKIFKAHVPNSGMAELLVPGARLGKKTENP